MADLFNQKGEGAAWKTKPGWYIVGTQDRTVNPQLQRFAAKRMNAATTEVTSTHVPMLSKPDVVLDVIRKAANAVQKPESGDQTGFAVCPVLTHCASAR